MGPYDSINKAWKGTCKVLFKEEIGDLAEFDDWLPTYAQTPRFEKSAISNKTVALGVNYFAKDAKFISHDEVDFSKKFEQLNINEIKDIDSIISALHERFYYTGNIVLGTSSHVEDSADLVNSSYIHKSSVITDSRYLSHCRYLEGCEYCFGTLGAMTSKYAIMCTGSEFTRCFECHSAQTVSDCYYCGSIKNCSNCMFCFGAQQHSYMIGNLQLSKEKYAMLKDKLVGEIAQELKKKKRIYSFFDILRECKKYPRKELNINDTSPEEPFDYAPIEKAFTTTTSLLFGKPLSKIEDYSAFLQRDVPENGRFVSPFGGKTVLVALYRTHISSKFGLDGRLLTDLEIRALGNVSTDKDIEKMDASLASVCETLNSIAYSDLNKQVGNNSNMLDATVVINAHDCCHGAAFVFCKKCAYCFWPASCENVFGSFAAWHSNFCMKCFNSKKLTRCFEVESSNDCSDLYYSHNCENVHNSMFCFNVKNKRNAIGNAQLEPGDYKSVKSTLISQVADELERKKNLKWSVYNIGSKRGNKSN